MKFSVEVSNILQALQTVSRAVAIKTTIPALTGIYFESINNNQLKLKATDLEIGIEYNIKVNLEKPGKMVVPARYLVELLKKLPNTIVTFSMDENNILNINYNDSKVYLNTFPVDQFSFLPEIEQKYTLNINTELLSNMIKKVSITCSTDVSQPVLNGALLEIDNNKIRMVTSDTYRLSLVENNIDINHENNIKPVIIPAKALNEISRFFDREGHLTVLIGENQAQFESNDMLLRVRLIEGVFPNYKNVIPNEYSTKVIIDTKEFLLSVERATIISNNTTNIATNTIKLEIEENIMQVKSFSPNIGQLNDKLYIEKEGEDINISFNGNFLIDILKVIDSEKVILELTGNLSPGIIKPLDQEKHFLSLILPVRS